MSSAQVVESKFRAVEARVSEDTISVDLEDGRTISVPISWYPRIAHGSIEEREVFVIIGNGTGIHWPVLDEDVSVEGLLMGRPSSESPESFSKWLSKRKYVSD